MNAESMQILLLKQHSNFFSRFLSSGGDGKMINESNYRVAQSKRVDSFSRRLLVPDYTGLHNIVRMCIEHNNFCSTLRYSSGDFVEN